VPALTLSGTQQCHRFVTLLPKRLSSSTNMMENACFREVALLESGAFKVRQ
jgi:hypothetical protein